ncbi:MAG: NmrA family NAD(P)-binding protein [Methylocystaceae bacterium]|nr:NmrA family NAD(P)-binding protein [Methylocystaceae bacterium]
MFVISGVTGNTGSIVAQALLDKGKDVRVIVRDEEKGKVWQDKGAEVVVADLFDISAMTSALTGAENAYLLLPPDLTHDDFLGSRKTLAENLIKAIEGSKIEHVTILSSVGAQLKEKTGPIRTVSYFESLLKDKPVKSTAIRPGFFLENWCDVLPLVLNNAILPSFLLPLDYKIDMVATQDIGHTVADALLHSSDDPHRVIELKGAQQYSANDVAQAFAKALGKEVTPVAVPHEEWQSTLTHAGLSTTSADLIIEMYDSINDGFITYSDAPTLTGETGLDAFVQKLVA